MNTPFHFGGIRAVVLFDLDGTMLNEHTGKTHPEMPTLLKTAADAGICCGWASSTSDLGLLAWERLLGIDDRTMPVRVSEDGLLCTAPQGWFSNNRGPHDKARGGRSWFTTDNNLVGRREQYRQLRDELRRWARSQDYGWVETHSSTWARLTSLFPSAHSAVIAVDITREGSFTCEVRQILGNGECSRLQANPVLTGKVVRPAVAEIAKRISLPDHLCENGMGWIDLPHPFATKGGALRQLRTLVPEEIPLIMVGNGSNDLSCAQIPGVQLVAVGDSTDTLKAVAHHVTAGPNFLGCHEYLTEVLLAVTA